MSDHKVKVMFDSPEAAQFKTVEGWVSRQGSFYGDDEVAARWAGCTHRLCKCGNQMDKFENWCGHCRLKRDWDAYEALPKEPWDGETPVYSISLIKFFLEGIEEILDDKEESLTEDDYLETLRLVHCDPVYLHAIDEDYWADDLPTDSEGELPVSVCVALESLNDALGAAGPISWKPSKRAVKLPVSYAPAEGEEAK